MKGLILGSGAAKGYAHIGALKILENIGIEFDYVVGCSIGAVVGAFYASGLSSSEMEEIALSLKPSRLLRLVMPARPSQAFLNSKKIEKFLEVFLPVRTFEELKRPFFVVATSLTTGKLKVFSSGEILPAIMASISIPIIFPAAQIEGEFFVDGGVLSPVPVEVGRKKFPNSKILAIDVTGSFKYRLRSKSKERLTIYESALYSVMLMQLGLASKEKHLADIVLEPELSGFEFYEFYRQKEIIEAGEREALTRKDEIIRKLL